jgi:hypothetical protein
MVMAMARSSAQLEPVIGHDAAEWTPWGSLWLLIAMLVGFGVFLPTYLAAGPLRAPILWGVAALSGFTSVLSMVAGSVILIKVNRAASKHISEGLGARLQFWGAYSTAGAWQRAIRRKTRHLPEAR